jgi:hypothetical protein
MKQKTKHLEEKLYLGVVSLGVGLIAANLALFNWVERTGVSYMLANYARYVCAYGGFGGMIFGAMLVNDFLVVRKRVQRKHPKDELTVFCDTGRKRESQPSVDRKPRKKVPHAPSRA